MGWWRRQESEPAAQEPSWTEWLSANPAQKILTGSLVVFGGWLGYEKFFGEDDDFYYGNSSTPRRRSGNPTSSKTAPGSRSYSGILYLGFILLVMIIVTSVMVFRSAEAPNTDAPVRDLEAQEPDLE